MRKLNYHGLSRHPLYIIWKSIKARCNNPNKESYKYYGGKGIKLCEEWSVDFMNFYNFAIENGWEKGLHTDRIKNEGNYCPENVRFVTIKENNRHKSDTKLSPEIAQEIRNAKLLLGDLITNKELQKAYGLKSNHLSQVLLNQIWI